MKSPSLERPRSSAFAMAGLLLSLSLLGASPAQAKGGVKVGLLTCEVSSGWGIVLASSRSADCFYSPASGDVERYDGNVSKFGADIGYVSSAKIVWAVFAPSADVVPAGLEGTYVGATTSASLGYGFGANVLLGGGRSFALQPVSVEGNSGLNLAAGVGTLSLSVRQ